MLQKRFLMGAVLAVTAGCGIAPSTPPASAPPAGQRSVLAVDSTQRKIPSLEELKRLIPAKLSREDGKRFLVQVSPERIILPAKSDRKTQMFGHRHFGSLGLGLGGLGFGLGLGLPYFGSSLLIDPLASIAGFWPFSYYGTNFLAPFFWDPLALVYTPFAFTSWITTALPYFATPFFGGPGCGLAPATILPTTLGCGGIL